MKDNKVFLMGFSHLLVSFTSIVVVTRILGFNIPMAFLFSGIATLLFHLITKNKLPVVMGVSGLYLGSIIYVANEYGQAYAMGGIVVAGLIYILFGLVMLNKSRQRRLMRLFPTWLLSATVMLIGLNLLPIGVSMFNSNMLIGVSAFLGVLVIDLMGSKHLKIFAMPIGVLIGTVIGAFTGAIDLAVLSESMALGIVTPKFSIPAVLAIAPVAFTVIFEMLGDIKNTSDIIGMDVCEEVGIGRVAIGNGVGTLVGGMFGANAYTTYSENSAFLMLTKYFNPKAQLITAVLMIIVAVTPICNLVMLIPSEALGGVVAYLFAMITVNAIKQLMNSGVDLNKDHKVFIIITVMLVVAWTPVNIMGISFSPVSIATLVGVVLNWLIIKPLKE